MASSCDLTSVTAALEFVLAGADRLSQNPCVQRHLPPFLTANMAKTPQKPRTSAETASSPPHRSQADTPSPAPIYPARKEYRFPIGKHRGKTVPEVVAFEPSYIQWCVWDGWAKHPGLKRAIEEYRDTAPYGKVLIPTMLSNKERRDDVRGQVPEWLYDECSAVLEPSEHARAWSRVTALQQHELASIKTLEEMVAYFPSKYPPRPDQTVALPESESVKELRAVLAKMPMRKLKVYQGPYLTAEDMKYLKFTEIPFPYDVHISLADDYTATIKKCLRAIEEEHGGQARAVANWEVRDTVRYLRIVYPE